MSEKFQVENTQIGKIWVEEWKREASRESGLSSWNGVHDRGDMWHHKHTKDFQITTDHCKTFFGIVKYWITNKNDVISFPSG